MMYSFFRRPNRVAYFVLSVAILAFACEDPKDSLGLDLIPDEDLLGLHTFTDSIQIDTYTVLADSARTNELSKALIGHVIHPDFGSTKSILYAQVRLSALSVDFSGGEDPPASLGLDSLVLSMEYAEEDSLYGVAEDMVFSVYQLSEALDVDSLYYSDHVTADLGEDLMYTPGVAIIPAPADSTMIYGSNYPPQLRLRLKDELGQALMDESANGSSFSGIAEFLEYFKGIKVSAITTGATGSILSFDLLSLQSKLTLYYHNAEADSLSFEFLINANSQRYLQFEHDYSASPIQGRLGDPSTRDQDLYLQSMAGVNIQVDMPSLLSITDTLNGAFNKVELVFPATNAMENSSYAFPDRLFAVYVDEEGDVISIPDIFEGDLHSDGYYDSANEEYRINITRFAQQVVTEVIAQPSLRLLPVSNAVSARWVRLNGVENMMGGAKLVITYTQYE